MENIYKNDLEEKHLSIIAELFKQMKPKPKTNTLEFSKKYGFLSGESSAAIGRFVPYPFQEQPLMATSDPGIELLVFIKSTRTGFTKTVNFSVAYHIAEDPCPQMMFVPNNGKAIEWAKREFKPLLRDMPIVGDKIYKNREDNVMLHKSYPGGFIGVAGLQTENNAASVTLKIIYVDEADRVPSDLGGEGDTFDLLAKRMESFPDGKMIIGSTPTHKGNSNIENQFEKTDKRYRYYPCPHCNHYQILKIKNLIWDKEYREGVLTYLTHTAGFRCLKCEKKFYQKSQRDIDAKAEWRQTQKFYCCEEWQDPIVNEHWHNNKNNKDDKRNGEALCVKCNLTAEYNRVEMRKVGYHVWSAMGYHPKSTWIKIADAFVNAIGSMEKMKSFHNTWLGETFEEKSVKLESNELMDKAEDYQNVPDDAKIVLMTVDTQDTWLEWVITSWSMGETSHNIKTGKIMGDPINQYVWDELLAIKRQALKTESGRDVKVYKGFIDMAGHRTDEVKKFIRKHGDEFVMLRGDPREPKDVDARPTSFIKKMEKEDYVIMWVATTKVKDIIFQRLALQPHEHGFIHHNRSFGVEWYKGLASEKKVFKKNARGKVEQTYINVAEDRRNEPLDITVYQLAAIRLIQAQIPSFDLSIKEEI